MTDSRYCFAHNLTRSLNVSTLLVSLVIFLLTVFSHQASAESPYAYWEKRCAELLTYFPPATHKEVRASFHKTLYQHDYGTFSVCHLYYIDHGRPEKECPEGRCKVTARRMGLGGPVDQDDNHCPVGNPISISSGRKQQKETLFEWSGPFSFDISLNYFSSLNKWTMPQSYRLFISQAWRNNRWVVPTEWEDKGRIPLDQYKFPSLSENTILEEYSVNLERPNGRYLTFQYESGTWEEVYNKNASLTQRFDANGEFIGWQMVMDNITEYYNFDGLITSRVFIGNYIMNYTYDERVTTISDNQGRQATLHKDVADQITKITDLSGSDFHLEYTVSGLLHRIIYPDDTPDDLSNNPKKTFIYDDRLGYKGLLIGIEDENNHRYATWDYDSRRRAILSEHNNGAERVELFYSSDRRNGKPITVVTNSLGKETTYYFDSINSQKKLIGVEGHASTNCAAANKAYTYDANGFTASKTDWKGNTTTYINNDRGQVLSRTEASGTPQARTITTEWHAGYNLPTKITEPSRIITMTYDTNGRLLSRNITER